MEIDKTINVVPGFRVGSVDAGLRKQPAPDLTLIAADGPCTAAAVFTTSQVFAAPVGIDRERVDDHPDRIRAILINTVVANAATGDPGWQNALKTAEWAAKEIGCAADEVLVMSTGVIGVQLPMEKIQAGIPSVAKALRPDGWQDAASAIMTTDTKPKLSGIQENGITIIGIAKGAGMIAPNMATMLSAVVTDAEITPSDLHEALRCAVGVSFNRIVIDGDMSTNDTVLLLASGASGKRVIGANLDQFSQMLSVVCTDLAKKIVRDGEGATRFIEILVTGAGSAADAHQIANTIAISPLVKTAFYGGDANWGRIFMAAGRAGVEFDQTKLSLWYDDLPLVKDGLPLDYSEDQANRIAHQPEVKVRLDLNQGQESAVVWTCDLSHDYVTINGHYRT